ncbi:aminoacyl-tRNA hydrolase [uncultured Sneathiella sp.]|jgi:PTH1 family peptidyl-tRNA hydrolase|uniref:aminoacyl-tRNA hydrolase n=1 Tax=uncultured Sneathiella sp. TaxID=879315 RepID=UPI0030DB645A|tara:strand:+ start:298 stop:906 length:609 start_codon:yes stop_codon:yes gene_type:complete
MMILLVGLGNPGKGYADNRHNFGYMAVDEIIRRHSFMPERVRFQGLAAEGNIGGTKILALKPTTYMNLSGQSVGEAVRFYKIPLENIIVLHDELDLPLGKIRVKTGGGHGGNNGLRSIIGHLGENFCRVRLGIGHPGEKHLVTGHVLSNFSKAEQATVEAATESISRHIDLLIDGDAPGFMNKLALDIAPYKNKDTDTTKGN